MKIENLKNKCFLKLKENIKKKSKRSKKVFKILK